MIKAKNLTKSYKKKLAVDNLSFQIAEGKVTGFVGPNGSGKSTTMRLMLGLDHGQGTTTFDEKILSDYPDPAKVVGILLEAKAFHPKRTARKHLDILATSGNIPKARVDEVLDIVGLAEVAKKRPGNFSLGMSQRLGIAAAILGEPKYLFLDEPANGLDPEGMVWLRDFIKEYADRGNGVFISSHLLNEMSYMADNIVVIGKGKLIANGSVKELTAGGGRGSVFVRTSGNEQLQKALDSKKLKYETEGRGLQVFGATSDRVGKIAFESKITVMELVQKAATLEDAFLELTGDAQEFHAKTVEGDK